MKTSARNQLQGTVTAIHPGAVNATVEISLNDHDRLSAMITMDSLAEMKLGPGSQVMALIKAPSVLIVLDDPTIKLSARNNLRGTVVHITRGAVNADVVLELPGGATLSAIITLESLDHLGLEIGQPACAVFKAGSVILGVKV